MPPPSPSKPVAERILALLFVALMAYVGARNYPNLVEAARLMHQTGHPTLRSKIATLEKVYSDKFFMKESFLDLNAFAHLAMGQNMMNEVVKDADGNLFSLSTNAPSKSAIAEHVQSAVSIYYYAEARSLPFLFVQKPYKFIRGQTVLPPGLEDTTNDRYDIWMELLQAQELPALDLRESIRDHIAFYKTDHHWSVRTAFFATKSIVETLNARYGLGLDPKGILTSIQNYKSLQYDHSLLGSHGIRVGPYFTGKDDFEMLIPLFDTQLHYRHFSAHVMDEETVGSFSEAFVNFPLLENPIYKNKYNACLKGGYVENVVENRLADNDLKVLLIADSFARPLVQYLSLCFRETRQLDPQTDRYTDSYLAYMESYKPDVVLIMYNGAIPL